MPNTKSFEILRQAMSPERREETDRIAQLILCLMNKWEKAEIKSLFITDTHDLVINGKVEIEGDLDRAEEFVRFLHCNNPSFNPVKQILDLCESLKRDFSEISEVRAIATHYPDLHWIDFEILLNEGAELSDKSWDAIQDKVIKLEWGLRDNEGDWFFRPVIVDRFFEHGKFQVKPQEESLMSVTFEEASSRFDELCDQAILSQKPIIINRPGGADVAIISLAELEIMKECLHVLGSPENAKRLYGALEELDALGLE